MLSKKLDNLIVQNETAPPTIIKTKSFKFGISNWKLICKLFVYALMLLTSAENRNVRKMCTINVVLLLEFMSRKLQFPKQFQRSK